MKFSLLLCFLVVVLTWPPLVAETLGHLLGSEGWLIGGYAVSFVIGLILCANVDRLIGVE